MNINNPEALFLITDELVVSSIAKTEDRIREFFNGNRMEIPSSYGPVKNNPEILWGSELDRTRGRYFHGMLFMHGWADYIIKNIDYSAYKEAAKLIFSWRKLNPVVELGASSMAYHDETTAQRLNTIMSIILAGVKLNDKDSLQELKKIALETSDLLASTEFHAGLNNHGMFQDISLRNYAVIARWDNDQKRSDKLSIALDRLEEYFIHAFTDEGVHIENTPTYHVLVSRNLHSHLKILAALEIESETLIELYKDAANYATYITMPNGKFPPISDTTVGARTSNQRIFDEYFLYASSAGKLGKVPDQNSALFRKSGYAIYRSDWASVDATYLLFQAAYNDNYHKHSDDLSLILYSAGQEIITESGPFSYNYADPYSRYAYSQFSHNSIVVDGRSIPRTDDKKSSVLITESQVTESKFEVTGVTGRLRGVGHTRTVKVTGPVRQETITVIDYLDSDESHNYEQFWHLAPGLEAVIHGNGFEVFKGSDKILDAFIETDFPIKISKKIGQTKPTVAGWSFPKFGNKVPSETICVTFNASSNAELKTRFELNSFSYVNRELHSKSSLHWQVASSARRLNYLEIKPKYPNEEYPLVFVFSAMAPVGNFSFNYKNTLDNSNAHVFYILDDFGDQGSYYLQEKGDLSIFQTVQDFIHNRIKNLAKTGQSIIFAGSSKGGTAAIIHGLRVPNSKIIVGAPQTKIGSFLKKPHPNVLRYMTGGETQAHVAQLDSLMYSPEFTTSRNSEISIIVGKSDHHYKNHVLPWVEYATSRGIEVELISLDGTPHSEIGKPYRRMLLDKVLGLSESGSQIESPIELWTEPKSVVAWFDRVSKRLFASTAAFGNTESSFRLYRNESLIDSVKYQEDNFSSWAGLPSGRYRVRGFIRSFPDKKVSAETSDWIDIP
ncbi:heparinase II/III domain-containing protein [Glutamicibacter nicotianae]|uniref:Heparinase II/III-like C-terminal domain-containing protein n=1 Tax=Glutamicibacter nicotianae TaxID=37929 RepID=A0ABQ0RIH3_GLUNI|nr:heparinase II/III family protein [Glutamicibacter nicotianae]GEC11261.1 hypothetical protein ANI01nite_04640 [Glutamicibacter nicotianae]